MTIAILYLAAIFSNVLMIKAENVNSLQNPENSDEEASLQNAPKKIVKNQAEIAIMTLFAKMICEMLSYVTTNIKALMPNSTEKFIFTIPYGKMVTIINLRNGKLGNFSTIELQRDVSIEKNETSYTIYMPIVFTDLKISYDYNITIGGYILLGNATSTIPKVKTTVIATVLGKDSSMNKIGKVLLEGERPIHMTNTYSSVPTHMTNTNSKNHMWNIIQKIVIKYTGKHLDRIFPLLVNDMLKSIVERTSEVEWA